MKYLKKFSNHNGYDGFINTDKFIRPNVSICKQEQDVHYNPYVPPHDYSQDYLTIESLEDDNTISWKASNSNLTKTISISTDNGTTWVDNTSNTSDITLVTLNTGDKLLVKGSNTSYGNSSNYNYFVSTKEFNVEGNIMSLVYGDDFIGQTILDSVGYNFRYLFYNCTKLKNSEHLMLPATTLAQYCYQYMFKGCTALITAPVLSATALASYCYQLMFSGCTALTTAPELPAITLARNCYDGMFWCCTSLMKAPELPATTLAIWCYYRMFYGCTSLTTAPALPATTLADICYQYMFYDCTSLNSITMLATDISASNCLYEWVSNVAVSGTFTKAASMTTLPRGKSGIPYGWTIQDYVES